MSKLSTLRLVGNFLFDHTRNYNSKYTQLLHPLIALISSALLYMLGTRKLEQLFEQYSKFSEFQESSSTRILIALGFLCYLALIIIVRYKETRNVVFYEMIWACNLSLLSSAYAFLVNKPLILAASMILVSIDQVLWYVDLLSYLLFKVFPIGVAKYLTWPTTSKLRVMTSFHHIFYLPLGFYFLRNNGIIPLDAWKMSIGMSSILTILSRFIAPLSIIIPGMKDEIYLNLNISHELWKDVPLQVLKFCDGKPWYMAIPYCSFMWNSGNYILGYWLLNLLRK